MCNSVGHRNLVDIHAEADVNMLGEGRREHPVLHFPDAPFWTAIVSYIVCEVSFITESAMLNVEQRFRCLLMPDYSVSDLLSGDRRQLPSSNGL